MRGVPASGRTMRIISSGVSNRPPASGIRGAKSMISHRASPSPSSVRSTFVFVR
jgi:hypothetical protein